MMSDNLTSAKKGIMMNLVRGISLLMVLVVAGAVAFGADWPQWRGPERNGVSKETHLLKAWPEEGPQLLWTVDGLGKGFSSVAVAKGLVYTTGVIAKEGYLFAFDLQGKLKWKTNYGPEFTATYTGTRGTPTVDHGQVYVYSGPGTVVCFDAASGKIRWSVDTVKEYGAQMVLHGICESLLVVDDHVICCPGGTVASIVALDKRTGKLAWQLTEAHEKQGYDSTILIKANGKRTVVAMMGYFVYGLDPNTGKVYWRYQHTPSTGGANWPCFTPLYQNNVLYLPSGKENDSAEGFAIAADNTKITRLWEQPKIGVHHGAVVIVDGYVYGTPGCGPGEGRFFCFDVKTGNIAYQSDKVGYANIIAADGMLYTYFQDGTVRLIAANPQAYQPISSFKIAAGTSQHWAHMALSDGRLFIRHGDSLLVYWVSERPAK